MKKTIGTVALLVLGIALVPAVAHANCGVPVIWGQLNPNAACAPDGFCYVLSPGTGRPTIEGNYWIIAAGNPAVGLGIDNGTQVADAFMPNEGFPNLYLKGDWTTAGIDNCVETVPVAVNAMAVGLSDIDGSAATGSFAAACAARNNAAAVEYDFTLIQPAGHITLKPIAKPTISGSTRVGNNSLVTIAAPDFSPIFYGDGSSLCTVNNVIKNYEVWVQQTGRGGAAPTDRNIAPSWTLGATCPTGTPCQVTVACTGGGNCDAFFAVAPKFDSNFQSKRVSPNSFRTQAGQTLATPPKPKSVRKLEPGVRNE